jgi:hypothetical protein
LAHGQHLFGIVLPIGREPQDAARRELGAEQGNEIGVEQAALVMTLLVPGVRKEHEHLIEARIGNRRFQDLDGVVTYDAQIASCTSSARSSSRPTPERCTSMPR